MPISWANYIIYIYADPLLTLRRYMCWPHALQTYIRWPHTPCLRRRCTWCAAMTLHTYWGHANATHICWPCADAPHIYIYVDPCLVYTCWPHTSHMYVVAHVYTVDIYMSYRDFNTYILGPCERYTYRLVSPFTHIHICSTAFLRCTYAYAGLKLVTLWNVC